MGFGLLKRCNCEFSTNGWKVVKKFLQGVSALDVIDERLDRDTGADEDGGATENVRVRVNDG